MFLKKPIRPLGSSKHQLRFELRSTFEELMPKIQKDIQIFFRASDSYLINLLEYDLVHSASFILKEESLRTKENDPIFPIKTDYQLSAENYQKAANEIEAYKTNLAQYKTGREEVGKVGKQMDYYEGKYGKI